MLIPTFFLRESIPKMDIRNRAEFDFFMQRALASFEGGANTDDCYIELYNILLRSGVASLMTDSPRAIYTTRQGPPICHPQLGMIAPIGYFKAPIFYPIGDWAFFWLCFSWVWIPNPQLGMLSSTGHLIYPIGDCMPIGLTEENIQLVIISPIGWYFIQMVIGNLFFDSVLPGSYIRNPKLVILCAIRDLRLPIGDLRSSIRDVRSWIGYLRSPIGDNIPNWGYCLWVLW